MDFIIDDLEVYQKPKIAKRIQIHVAELSFNKHVLLRVLMFGSEENYDSNIVDVKMIRIDGDEYKAWGNDDTYIENIVFEKLGIHKRVMEEDKKDETINEEIVIEEAIIEPLQM